MPEPLADQLAALRPSRWSLRLRIWIGLSIAVHLAFGAALWYSDTLRGFLFSSFRDHPQITDLDQLARGRAVFDALIRKRMIEANKRTLDVSRKIDAKRVQTWDGVKQRAATNPHFKEMLDSGLPPLTLATSAGDAATQDILALYAQGRELEENVFALYEQYKGVDLSLSAVSEGPDGQKIPQQLADSLALVKLERPDRPDLDKPLLNASNQELFAMRPVASAPPEDGKAAKPAFDGYQRWRAEATKALELCEIMANNCQRILDNVENGGLYAVDGGVGPGSGSFEAVWEENHTYRGETYTPPAGDLKDLATDDLEAELHLGKHLGKPGNAGSFDAKYLVLDTWWEIGPFAYIGGKRTSASLSHKYPPENGVDLDATYLGRKDTSELGLTGSVLRWQYRPMSQLRQEPKIVIPRALWYFYTEFWSDQAMDVMANIATDDYGAVWLTESPKPVYISGEEGRPWVILDRRQNVLLRLKQGTNRMLLKLDNKGGTTGFTVILKLK